jgi:hypothetical protein
MSFNTNKRRREDEFELGEDLAEYANDGRSRIAKDELKREVLLNFCLREGYVKPTLIREGDVKLAEGLMAEMNGRKFCLVCSK